ncbi:MAG: hypothetical protein ACREH8_20365, partial [Opitutaceae bacterium]
MSVLKTLRDTVAPELNHLYTTPPADTPDGLDCGWHGREHALHAFLIARMFGASADIRTGDFAVLSPYLPPLTSIDRKVDHTWCTVNGGGPVDLALNVIYFGQAPQLRTAIVGEGRNGDWDVQYTDDESVLDENFGHTNEIIYIEREIHSHSESALLNDPYLLLPAPNAGDTGSWPVKYGPGIFAKITHHCHACATR